jgi:hypothetical protein
VDLRNTIRLRQIAADGLGDWGGGEYFGPVTPIPTDHPPSLKNPQKVKWDNPTDGWHPNDSKKARKDAMERMAVIHQLVRRQIGKPEVSQTAQMPLFPDIEKWF